MCRPDGGRVLCQMKKEREVFADCDVVPECLDIVAIEKMRGKAAEENPGDGANEDCEKEPCYSSLLRLKSACNVAQDMAVVETWINDIS